MQDRLREAWIKKEKNPEKINARKKVVPKKRNHKTHVMNCSMKPIFINGLGDTAGGVLLGVLGEDETVTAIHNIGRYTDQEIDNCPSYEYFITKKYIKEIDEQTSKRKMSQVLQYINNEKRKRQKTQVKNKKNVLVDEETDAKLNENIEIINIGTKDSNVNNIEESQINNIIQKIR